MTKIDSRYVRFEQKNSYRKTYKYESKPPNRPSKYTQLIIDRGAKESQWRKDGFFQ